MDAVSSSAGHSSDSRSRRRLLEQVSEFSAIIELQPKLQAAAGQVEKAVQLHLAVPVGLVHNVQRPLRVCLQKSSTAIFRLVKGPSVSAEDAAVLHYIGVGLSQSTPVISTSPCTWSKGSVVST